MKTDETPTQIAIQPETDLEQQLLAELFTRMNSIQQEVQAHPEKVGSTRVFYTLDIPEYDLDEDLWDEAECGVNDHGQLDPEPGSRALVITHSSAEESQPTEEDIDKGVEAVKESVEDAQDDEAETGPQTTEELHEDSVFEEALEDEGTGPDWTNPCEMTVDELRDELRDTDYDAKRLRSLYKTEVNGEARKTALDAIQTELDKLEEDE